MTETEWLAGNDLESMLVLVRRTASERKLRLFGVACCRLVDDHVKVGAVAAALEIAEQYADTGKSKAALKRARQGVKSIRHAIPNGDKARVVEWVDLWLAEVVASENAFGGVAGEIVRLTSSGLLGPTAQSSLPMLLHCSFGNRFRHVTADTSWLTPAVHSLVKTAYDEHHFERMSELAGSLEQAGCTQQDILQHCREAGPHVRGCWVTDLLLGKT